MIRVAIVDDHPIARRGVEQILVEAESFQVVSSAGSAAELAEQLGGQPAGDGPDVLLLDLYYDGDEPCLQAITQLRVAMRVLVMSASGRPADVLGAIRAGASGYVTKQSSPQTFLDAVESVAGGGFYLSSHLADILQSELTGPAEPPAVPPPAPPRTTELSPREQETLGLIARGFTHGQTATRMGISKATVDTYVERIRSKLQVGNKAELTRAALTRLSGELGGVDEARPVAPVSPAGEATP